MDICSGLPGYYKNESSSIYKKIPAAPDNIYHPADNIVVTAYCIRTKKE
jgi:hypothetical protein